ASGINGVYAISADGGTPRSLVVDTYFNAEPSFSQDGRWVYYVSNRSGSEQIWKTSPGGTPVQVTSHGGHMPMESPDGRFLYYTKAPRDVPTAPGSAGLWRMPAAGGEESRVPLSTLNSPSAEFFWTTAPTGIYFIDDGKPVLKFFDTATGEQSVV